MSCQLPSKTILTNETTSSDGGASVVVVDVAISVAFLPVGSLSRIVVAAVPLGMSRVAILTVGVVSRLSVVLPTVVATMVLSLVLLVAFAMTFVAFSIAILGALLVLGERVPGEITSVIIRGHDAVSERLLVLEIVLERLVSFLKGVESRILEEFSMDLELVVAITLVPFSGKLTNSYSTALLAEVEDKEFVGSIDVFDMLEDSIVDSGEKLASLVLTVE